MMRTTSLYQSNLWLIWRRAREKKNWSKIRMRKASLEESQREPIKQKTRLLIKRLVT